MSHRCLPSPRPHGSAFLLSRHFTGGEGGTDTHSLLSCVSTLHCGGSVPVRSLTGRNLGTQGQRQAHRKPSMPSVKQSEHMPIKMLACLHVLCHPPRYSQVCQPGEGAELRGDRSSDAVEPNVPAAQRHSFSANPLQLIRDGPGGRKEDRGVCRGSWPYSAVTWPSGLHSTPPKVHRSASMGQDATRPPGTDIREVENANRMSFC